MPHFILVEGGLGHGKTLIASVLAHYWRLRSGGEVRIFANYDLAESTPLDAPERWLDIADARGSICIWDEAQQQFDRRLWQRNILMSQIFNMTRKLRAVHIFTNPVGNNLDSRILDLVEIRFHVQKFPGRCIKLDVYENQDKRFGDWGRYMKTLIIPWHKVKSLWSLNLYDTDQMLYPFPTPSTEAAQLKLLKQIAERQREAAEREKRGINIEGDLVGWINPSDHYRDKARKRDGETDGERPQEIENLISVHS